jgi:hypothetical protein
MCRSHRASRPEDMHRTVTSIHIMRKNTETLRLPLAQAARWAYI